MSLEAVVGQVQLYMGTLSGIRQADTLPPNTIASGLVSICYPQTTNYKQIPAGNMQGLHELLIEISLPDLDRPRDVDRLLPFVESVPNLLFKQLNSDHWNHTIDTIGEIDVNWPPCWKDGDMWRRGIQFIVHKVKIQTVIS